ncbi:MAG: 3-dehydroquinate synthase, partial [Opitutae bacterium]|nr:3-dehydroquinate synthase [Opitutae bacterium]
LLNLGHTFAHAIESVAGYGEYLHGEAVSIGLVCALRLSLMSGHCSKSDEDGLITLLQLYALPTELKVNLSIQALMKAMQSDKKIVAGSIRFVALKNIGDAFLSSNFNSDHIQNVWSTVGAK